MGLQGQLSNISSDSIPLLLLSLFATFINHLKSFILHLTTSNPNNLPINETFIASGLTSIIVLTNQLSLNRLFSYKCTDKEGRSDCVVCLLKLQEGEDVRKLECGPVYHKECFERWICELNFTCPLCRSVLVSDGFVSKIQCGVGRDLVSCFSLH